MRDQPGFFDVDDRLKRLSDLGDQLEAFRAAVDFEMFRPDLDAALAYSDGAQGGRPPFDPVMMFKVLVIQTTNNLSDERAEFLINDRLFMRFLGLGLSDRIPDARTIWLFRKAGAIGPLFERFDTTLRQSGYIAMSGQIVDASLIAAPRQRNTNEEKAAIKAGRVPDNWKDKPAKLRQKDRVGRSSSPRPSRARMARRRWSIWRFRSSAIKTTSRLIVASASFANGARQTPLPMKAVAYVKDFSTRPTLRAQFGRTRPIARKPTKSSWKRTASSAMSIARSRRVTPCRRLSRGRTTPNQKSDRGSSISSPSRRPGWTCSSAPSGLRGQR